MPRHSSTRPARPCFCKELFCNRNAVPAASTSTAAMLPQRRHCSHIAPPFSLSGSRRGGSLLICGVHSLKQRRRRKGSGQCRIARIFQLFPKKVAVSFRLVVPLGIPFCFTLVLHLAASFPSVSCNCSRSFFSANGRACCSPYPCGISSMLAISLHGIALQHR